MAADKDYSVETFIVPDGPKVNFVYQKSEKTQFWSEAQPYITKIFPTDECHFWQIRLSYLQFEQGGDGGMEYNVPWCLVEARSLEGLLGLMIHEGAHLGISNACY